MTILLSSIGHLVKPPIFFLARKACDLRDTYEVKPLHSGKIGRFGLKFSLLALVQLGAAIRGVSLVTRIDIFAVKLRDETNHVRFRPGKSGKAESPGPVIPGNFRTFR